MPFPTIRRGTRWGQTRADDWNTAFRSISDSQNQLARLKNPSTSFPTPDRIARRAIRVAIVDTVSVDSPLKLREVVYRDKPPILDQLRWNGNAFDGFPLPGVDILSFQGSEWTDIEPASGIKLFDAWIQDDIWFVAKSESQGNIVKEFKIVGIGGDVLSCVFTDPNLASEPQQAIARPWMLRQTPFDGINGTTRNNVNGAIRYEYLTHSRRKAIRMDDPTDMEVQVIVPSYQVDDIVYATKDIDRTLFDIPALPNEPSINARRWLDDNRDARAWARDVDQSF